MFPKAKSRTKRRRYTVNNKDKPEQGKLLFGAQEQARALKDAIMAHETTRQQLIALYGKMYDDLVCPKVELINRAFEQNMTYINNSDISKDDKYTALGYVTDKIAELVGQLGSNK